MSILPCCRDATALLTEDAEGMLTGFEKLKFAAHLRICAVCQRMRSQMRTTAEVLRGLGAESLQAPVAADVDAIMTRLAAAPDETDETDDD
jgi:hypothetical protein